MIKLSKYIILCNSCYYALQQVSLNLTFPSSFTPLVIGEVK